MICFLERRRIRRLISSFLNYDFDQVKTKLLTGGSLSTFLKTMSEEYPDVDYNTQFCFEKFGLTADRFFKEFQPFAAKMRLMEMSATHLSKYIYNSYNKCILSLFII